MADLFSSDLVSDDNENEDWAEDEIIETPFNPEREIILTYGTESVRVDIMSATFRGQSLRSIAAMKSDELGFARNPDDLNFKTSKDYVDRTSTPIVGQEYILSAVRDTKGN
jgi:hypothetical protein